MLQFSETINSATTLLAGREVPKSRASHQFDFSGTTGNVTIELDAYTGYRLIETVDLTKADREPFVVVCEARAFRVTPSVSTTLAYCTTHA